MRDATMRDMDALLALENACYPPRQAYSRVEYRYALATARAVNILVEAGTTLGGEPPRPPLLGFIGAFYHKTWRVGHIYTVNVHPDARGKGLGKQLVAACEARLAELGMRRVVLEVNVENAGAIALYESSGYRKLGFLKDYYTQYDVNDAWQYAKTL
jgi:ribosomal protein S18 acetylase RimI-like enzyme